MKQFIGYLYQIVCKKNSKLYVGITNNMSGRWYKHVYDAKHNSPCVIHRAMRKYGITNFEMKLLETVSSQKRLLRREKFWIKNLKSHVSVGGYNETFGGEKPMLGRHHSAKSKRLIGEKLKGRVSPYKGKSPSYHTRKLLSAIHSKSVVQLDLSGKVIKIHKSIIAAGKCVGVAGSNISGVCRGKKKTAGGFRWQYEEN